jgi:hypothetical protein
MGGFTMSGFSGFAIEVCDAMERVTGDGFNAMLDWLEGYEGDVAEGVCTLLEGDSDVQDGPVVPMYERTVGGRTRLNPDFRARLLRVLGLMTCRRCRSWCIETADEAEANPDSVMHALLKAYAHRCGE